MNAPLTMSLAFVLTVLAFAVPAGGAVQSAEDDALARIIRRPPASEWVTGNVMAPAWTGELHESFPMQVIGEVRKSSLDDRLERTRTTLGLATTGSITGRSEHSLFFTATLDTGTESPSFPIPNATDQALGLGIHHGWRLGTDLCLRSSLGWRTGPGIEPSTVWSGFGIRFDF